MAPPLAPRAKARPGRAFGPAAGPPAGAAPVARISRRPQHEHVKIYGLIVDPRATLRPFPTVATEDADLLDPLPGVNDVIDFGRFKGVTFAVMAADAGNDWYNVWVLEQTLACKESTCPGLFRYAYFLYSLVQASHRYAVSTLIKRAADEEAGLDPMHVEQGRQPPPLPYGINHYSAPVIVNVQFGHDPTSIHNQECSVMVADESAEDVSAYEVDEEPGLAVLDTACGKTMNGAEWRSSFEQELQKWGLTPVAEARTQTFRGVGGSTVSRESITWPVGI